MSSTLLRTQAQPLLNLCPMNNQNPERKPSDGSEKPSQKPFEAGQATSSSFDHLRITPRRDPAEPPLILYKAGSERPESRSSLWLQARVNLCPSQESLVRPIQTRYFSTLQATAMFLRYSGNTAR
jgi:hypothetical protein